jgi:hypothetical protein
MIDYGRIETNNLCYIGMMVNHSNDIYTYDPMSKDHTAEYMAEQIYAELRGWLD